MNEKNKWMEELDFETRDFLLALQEEGITANPEYWLNISEKEKQEWMPQIKSKEIL